MMQSPARETPWYTTQDSPTTVPNRETDVLIKDAVTRKGAPNGSDAALNRESYVYLQRRGVQIRVKHLGFKNRNTTKGHCELRQTSYTVQCNYINKCTHYENQHHYN